MTQTSLFDQEPTEAELRSTLESFAEAQGLRTVDSPSVGFSHRNAGKTERAAAKKQVLSKTRRKVLVALVEAGSHGLTRPEIVERTGLPLQSVCGRVVDLVDNLWAFKTYRSRNGCGVLIATDAGKRQVASPAGAGLTTNPPHPVPAAPPVGAA